MNTLWTIRVCFAVAVVLAVAAVAAHLYGSATRLQVPRYSPPPQERGTTTTMEELPLQVSQVPPPKTYVVALKYAGQQGSGIRSLSVMQCMLSSMYKHFYIVEPFVEGTHIWTYTLGGDRLTFGSLFNFNFFNAQSKQMGYPEMVSFDEFSKSSPDHVIYVFVREIGSKQDVIWTMNMTNDDVKCLESKEMQEIPQLYRSAFADEESKIRSVKPKGCIVRAVELKVINSKYFTGNASKQQVDEVYDFIFDKWLPEEVTLIFNMWYNKLFVPVHMPLHGIDCLHVYAKNETKVQFQPSQRLLEDAKRYKDMFLGGQNRLAIMLRVERVIKHYLKESDHTGVKPRSLKDCFKEVVRLESELENDSNSDVFVTLDVGSFGTQSFHSNMIKYIEDISAETLVTLYHNKWSMNEWEKSFIQAAGGVTNKGYIAALQRSIASRADCLVLMGGGSFQTLAVHEYTKHHKSDMCVHLVCVMTQSNTEVQKVLEST